MCFENTCFVRRTDKLYEQAFLVRYVSSKNVILLFSSWKAYVFKYTLRKIESTSKELGISNMVYTITFLPYYLIKFYSTFSFLTSFNVLVVIANYQ